MRNNLIMWNIIYVEWLKEINETEKHVRVFAAPFFGANLKEQLLCSPFITARWSAMKRLIDCEKSSTLWVEDALLHDFYC